MATELSSEDKAFLEACEEEFKDRYTENDTEFMKVFTAEPSVPPIIENWWSHKRLGQQNNRRYAPYDKEKSHRDRGYQGSHDRGYQGRRDRGYQGSRDGGSHNNGYSRGYSDYHQSDSDYNPNYNRFHRPN